MERPPLAHTPTGGSGVPEPTEGGENCIHCAHGVNHTTARGCLTCPVPVIQNCHVDLTRSVCRLVLDTPPGSDWWVSTYASTEVRQQATCMRWQKQFCLMFSLGSG